LQLDISIFSKASDFQKVVHTQNHINYTVFVVWNCQVIQIDFSVDIRELDMVEQFGTHVVSKAWVNLKSYKENWPTKSRDRQKKRKISKTKDFKKAKRIFFLCFQEYGTWLTFGIITASLGISLILTIASYRSLTTVEKDKIVKI